MSPSRPLHVLVADDDDDIRYMVSHVLGRHGWDITMATSGEDALAVLEEASFDALVLDQNMPPGSGISVARACRARGEDTLIVLFTGYVETLSQQAAQENQVTVMDKTQVRRLERLLEDLAETS